MTQREPIAAGGPTPPAEDLDDAQQLARAALRRAIELHRETAERARRVGELADRDRRLDAWAELESTLATEAEAHLIRAVLATGPTPGAAAGRLERHALAPRAVRSGRTIYLATPSTELDLAPGSPAGPWVMRLVILDGAALVDLDSGGPILAGDPDPPPPAEPPAPAPPGWDQVQWKMLGDAAVRLGFGETWRRLFGPVVERLDSEAGSERPS